MARNPRYDILFEPLRIGPVTTRNRFYQTPHAIGMGYDRPRSSAAYRAMKAAGGWGVVCTEYCSIHPSADETPFAFQTLWDEEDVRSLALTAEAVHAEGALAGIELWHGGFHTNNRMTRETPLAPSAQPLEYHYPAQARAMDRADIRALRQWQVEAARRALQADFDIVYVYAGHDYLPFQFLSRRSNHRVDEYGGSLENRARLLRELVEETKEAVGHRCAVAIRLAVDELHGPQGILAEGEGRDVVALLAELPDLWDVNVGGGLGNDSKSARFSAEGFQERYVAFVKGLTTKPVVGVGRFTSPDAMVSQLRRGVLDLVGAARPSIADPFLPRKIEEGREDEIRECIGCNICRSANNEGAPIRCTQNPTAGEEWRRGWHPEVIAAADSSTSVLVVGAGPAGLECARALGQRGYPVTLAEAGVELGGRLLREARLPGLATWLRVRDWRSQALARLPNVEVYRGSALSADDILSYGFAEVVLATGARWRRDGVGSATRLPVPGCEGPQVLTPDEVLAGALLADPVVLYDDDHYYMAGCLAERLATAGHRVALVTPEARASAWTAMTNEQGFVQARLLALGVEILALQALAEIREGEIELACVYSGRRRALACGSLVLATGRLPEDRLERALRAEPAALERAGIRRVTAIGDCRNPSSVADAVWWGHRFAREFDTPPPHGLPFRRERVLV